MPRQNDLRVVRTKQMIKDAFIDLMAAVGFSKITVEGLTKKAFINRNTFYLHYTDKYDLLNQLENEVLSEIESILSNIPFHDVKENGLADLRVVMIMRHAFEYIQDNSRFFQLIMSEKGDPAFLHKLGETFKAVITRSSKDSKLKIPQRYMLAIVTAIQTNVIGEWLRGGMQESPEEIVTMVTTLFKDVPKNLFRD